MSRRSREDWTPEEWQAHYRSIEDASRWAHQRLGPVQDDALRRLAHAEEAASVRRRRWAYAGVPAAVAALALVLLVVWPDDETLKVTKQDGGMVAEASDRWTRGALVVRVGSDHEYTPAGVVDDVVDGVPELRDIDPSGSDFSFDAKIVSLPEVPVDGVIVGIASIPDSDLDRLAGMPTSVNGPLLVQEYWLRAPSARLGGIISPIGARIGLAWESGEDWHAIVVAAGEGPDLGGVPSRVAVLVPTRGHETLRGRVLSALSEATLTRLAPPAREEVERAMEAVEGTTSPIPGDGARSLEREDTAGFTVPSTFSLPTGWKPEQNNMPGGNVEAWCFGPLTWGLYTCYAEQEPCRQREYESRLKLEELRKKYPQFSFRKHEPGTCTEMSVSIGAPRITLKCACPSREQSRPLGPRDYLVTACSVENTGGGVFVRQVKLAHGYSAPKSNIVGMDLTTPLSRAVSASEGAAFYLPSGQTKVGEIALFEVSADDLEQIRDGESWMGRYWIIGATDGVVLEDSPVNCPIDPSEWARYER